MESTVEFRILGPLEVRDESRVLPVHGGKQRALLALLLLNANRTLAIERIVDELWGESAPETASKMVQIYVSQLRKLLPGGSLRTQPPGYALEIEPDQLDLRRFERLVVGGRASLAEGDAKRASEQLAEALALWRGPALVEFASEPFARLEAARLEDQRLAALEERIEADLACGREADLVGELESLVARHPLREGLRRRLMLALYRSGRQAEALAAYQEARRVLSEELGLEPSLALRELQRRILEQDPGLQLPTGAAAASSAATATTPETRYPRVAEVSDVRYARSGAANIAYQVVGDGPVDLLYIPGWISHLDLYWEEPTVTRFLRRLAEGFRLMIFDRRGTGLSDRVPDDELPTLEGRMDDLRAVLDAVESEQAVLMAQGYGCPLAIIFAATYPERTRALILYNAIAKTGERTDDYPWGTTPEEREAYGPRAREQWGSEGFAAEWLRRLAPSAAGDPRMIAWHARLMRASATPSSWQRFARMSSLMDVRALLPLLHVPTLVLVRKDVRAPKGAVDVRSVEEAEYVAERIPRAQFVVLPGEDYLPWFGDQEALVSEVMAFATGTRPVAEPDRVLLTVLFTDIVDSTGWLAKLGDQRWRELLGEHDLLVRQTLERFRGSEVDHAGDGVLATFDGPGRAIRCACELGREVRQLGLEIRAGIHTGECELMDGKVFGIAVNTGARVVQRAGPGEVVVTSTVKDLVAGSDLRFADLGMHDLRGIPGEWRLFAVKGGSP